MSESNYEVLTAAEDCFASENSITSLARFKKNKLSRSQFGLLVDYMSLNPELVMGKHVATHLFRLTKEVWTKKWEELADLLNADWTGPKRDASRWRKAWADQKNLLRIKAERRDECIALTGDDQMYKLTELEERLLKLINYTKKESVQFNEKKAHKCSEKTVPINNLSLQPVHNASPQIISPSGYIVFGVQANNIPSSLQLVNPSSSNMETANVLIGLEPKNILTGLQSSSDIPKKEEQTIMSVSSAAAGELIKSPNKRDNELNLKIVDSCSLMQTQVEDSKEKDTLSLIHESEPYEVSRTIENGITSDNGQSHKNSEKTENVVNSSSQNSSGSPCAKKRKLSHKSLLTQRNKFTVTKLLQKQNDLLEGIAATLTRIEKSVKEKSSVEGQRKNKMLTNISENIEMLAESLGTVSKSLKAITEN